MKKKKWIITSVILVVFCAGLFVYNHYRGSSSAADPAEISIPRKNSVLNVNGLVVRPQTLTDGITSVGMMEHVGAKNYRHYFDEMFKLLKPAGRLLNHQITISKDKPNNRPGTDEFLDRYIFPDGDLASPGFIESALHDAGFEVVNQENLRQHYALTLHHWNANLKANWADAVKQVGYERAKVYGLYLAACELNFELNGIQVHQFLAVKPDKEGLPKGNWYPLRPWWAA